MIPATFNSWRPSRLLSKLLSSKISAPAGDALTNPTVKTAFASTYTLPANSLKVGDVIRINFQIDDVLASSSTTIVPELAIGGTTFGLSPSGAASGLGIPGQHQTLVTFEFTVTAVGASGTLQGYGLLNTYGTTVRFGASNFTDAAIDTTVANIISMSLTCGTSGAANVLTLKQFNVEIVR